MKEELEKLARLRSRIEIITAGKDNAETEYKATTSYQEYLVYADTLKALKAQEEEVANDIREQAVELSKATGYETRKFDKVEVKEFTVVSILDTKQAVQWAAQNAPSTLSLTKDFDKVAKSLELPFVKVEKVYRGQVASDLSSLLVE